MRGDEARVLLGFPHNSRPTPSQVKAAFKKKVWESHPDLFPVNEKLKAESRFKRISEAYSCLLSGSRGDGSSTATYSRVVRTGVPRTHGGRGNRALIGHTKSRGRTILLTTHFFHNTGTPSQSLILMSYMDGLDFR
ncbi:chaperone protein DnaJ isoform X3 [Punica granatum]|uniref:Chaperone protein DnaJ isoform X3 n=1 Tax=Punica granatum TaxID=22663 RepID=A0A6P8CF56_PUNGR|nr:chaperone protein DnaJ isoform X3 [Punica granatum]